MVQPLLVYQQPRTSMQLHAVTIISEEFPYFKRFL